MRWPKNIFLADFLSELVVILVFAAGSLVLAVIVKHPIWEDPQARVFLPDGTVVAVEIVDSSEERRVGLSEHVRLDPDAGMLFLFDEPGVHAFWMKGMDFPIDIIWLMEETIVDITFDVPVPTGPDLLKYGPNASVDRVLEVNAGFAAAHGLVPGDFLDIRLP